VQWKYLESTVVFDEINLLDNSVELNYDAESSLSVGKYPLV
jgi:hypothetical protein